MVNYQQSRKTIEAGQKRVRKVQALYGDMLQDAVNAKEQKREARRQKWKAVAKWFCEPAYYTSQKKKPRKKSRRREENS